MKNTNFPQNNNVKAYSINRIMSAPEQSPMLIPANVETPIVLQGDVSVISGSNLFEYTNITTGEFTIDGYSYLIMTIDYVLTPASNTGNLELTVYKNNEVYLTLNHEIVHTDNNPDVGMIDFEIAERTPTDVWKITGYTGAENIVFADVTNSNGIVERSALTMFIQEAGV
ncbi:hypothetical protein HAV_00073 [Candidatus Hepatincola sp. Av]